MGDSRITSISVGPLPRFGPSNRYNLPEKYVATYVRVYVAELYLASTVGLHVFIPGLDDEVPVTLEISITHTVEHFVEL